MRMAYSSRTGRAVRGTMMGPGAVAVVMITPPRPSYPNAPAASPVHPQAPALDQRLHLGHGDPREVPWDRVLERAHRRPVRDRLVEIGVDQAVQQAGHEGVARPEPVHDLDGIARAAGQPAAGAA